VKSSKTGSRSIHRLTVPYEMDRVVKVTEIKTFNIWSSSITAWTCHSPHGHLSNDSCSVAGVQRVGCYLGSQKLTFQNTTLYSMPLNGRHHWFGVGLVMLCGITPLVSRDHCVRYRTPVCYSILEPAV
jgi:hypothetical protein